MIRRRHGVSLTRSKTVEEDIDPNASVSNIADCMLVLVLGLFVALVIHYNVDLQEPETQQDKMTGVEVNMDQDENGVIDGNYTHRGSVYYDQTTGNYYYVEDE